MRIGVFDSGLGGLLVAQSIIRRLPEYDYLYLGDTKRVPYGNRSQETIHEFVAQALDYLFSRDCQLIVLACNTASAEALRKSQQEYLPRNYPDRRVLGVVIPMAEAAIEAARGPVAGAPTKEGARIGVIATTSTVESGAYVRELNRAQPGTSVIQNATPLLVPLVENDGLEYVDAMLDDYLEPLKRQEIESLILGCTHYAALKEHIRSKLNVPVLSPDEVVPEKLADYLERHPEIESKLAKTGERIYEVTDLTSSYQDLARRVAGEDVELKLTSL
ncbi:MAG: glutamate racemase [Fimbriimonadaceae bacterium]|jgi:glutamate racemase|nr:glutamate racemase [Fimbriimonadaceae bacterium]